MPRIRSIHPDACDSEKLSSLSDSAERTFFRLLTHTDDEGRGEDRPKLLAAKLYPLHDGKDAGTVDDDLDELQGVGLLVRYIVAGKRYYAIPTFRDWQNPRHPTASKLPSPDEADPDPDGISTAERGNATAVRGKAPAGVGGGVGVGEGGDESASDSVDALREQFAEFWDSYPRHAKNGKTGGGGNRKTAFAKWKRMTAEERDKAMRAAVNYRAWVESPDGEFPKHANTWLNADGWDDWLDPPRLSAVKDRSRSLSGWVDALEAS